MNIRWKVNPATGRSLILQVLHVDGLWKNVPMVDDNGRIITEHPAHRKKKDAPPEKPNKLLEIAKKQAGEK